MTRPDLTLTDWTPEEMDALAVMTPERQAEAAAWWRARAPRRFRRLLDAQPVQPETQEVSE